MICLPVSVLALGKEFFFKNNTYHLLNIGYVSNETNTDIRMYIEEFILVEIWIHCCTKVELVLIALENTLVYIQMQQLKRNVRIALG